MLVKKIQKLTKAVTFLSFAPIMLVPLAVTVPYAAMAAYQMPLRTVEVSGNQRVDKATIMRYAGLELGQQVDATQINNAIKQLYQTGFFAEVQVQPQTEGLLITVVENPMVSEVVFQGNKEIEEDKLRAEVNLKPRSLYTRPKIQADVERILALYRRSGRLSVTVTPTLEVLEQNRVRLTFAIVEGEVTKIGDIAFIGNKDFSASTLQAVINSDTSCWYCFLSENDTYDPDKVAYDKELLRRFYTKQGYADFTVKSVVAELSPDRKSFFLTFTVEEGKKYDIGKVSIVSSLPNTTNTELQKYVTLEEGETYNAEAVEQSIDKLVEALGDKGFAFVDINPEVTRLPDNKIDISFKVAEGPRVYVERINIEGNLRTLDEVVRREFRLAEGDAYSTSKMQRSEQRIRNLGFFEDVKVTTEKGSAPDRVVVKVDVAEQSTGEVTLGGGFSTVDGLLADVGIRERNLLGNGQELRLRGTFAQKRQQYDLGFTEPYFLGREIAAGFDLYNTLQDFRTQSSFDRQSTGGRLRFGYALTENLRQDLYYSYQQTNIQNIRTGASRFIRDQEGTNTTSLVGQSLTYDRLDNKIDPRDGYLVRANLDLAGLGGNSEFVRPEARGQFYYSFSPDWTFMQTATGGYVHAFNQGIRVQDRFFIGQREMRGFSLVGIGPRDRITNDALGGNVYYTTTTELQFPLGLPNDMGIRGAVFMDTGTLYGLDQSGSDVLDDSGIRMTAGLGLAWNSPFGPLRLDYGQAFVKEAYDDTQNFRFSFGSRF